MDNVTGGRLSVIPAFKDQSPGTPVCRDLNRRALEKKLTFHVTPAIFNPYRRYWLLFLAWNFKHRVKFEL